MRIVYIVLHLDSQIIYGGVGAKINTQARFWREQGHTVDVFVLSPDNFQTEGLRIYSFCPSPHRTFLPKLVTREISRSLTLKRLINDVASSCPDIIFLRYGLFTIPLQELFNIAPVIVEINSNDIDEYRYRGQLFFWINKLTRGIILSKAAGFVAISNEIAQSPGNRIYKKPLLVTANGIDLVKHQPLPAPTNQTPVLVMAVSPGYNWHGVDKLQKLALRYPDIRFSIIGYKGEDFGSCIPSNMQFHGFVEHQRVKTFLSQADAAIGTLALYRKNMNEASPLKVREALAYGLPLIIAYQDTDLIDLDTNLILRLPNTEDNIESNMDRIHEFAFQMIGKRIDRTLIYPRIDLRKKEQAKLAFFEDILRQKARKD